MITKGVGMENITRQVEHLKQYLVTVAEKHHFDFLHPEVLRISKKIDELLLVLLKNQRKAKSDRFTGR